VDPLEWRFLLAGATDSTMDRPNPAPEWLTDKAWIEILNLSKLERFTGFQTHVAAHVRHYKAYFDSSDAHREKLAGEWEEKLTRLQKLLVVRCFRVDKAMVAIQVRRKVSGLGFRV
jgi:dynein heavy chain